MEIKYQISKWFYVLWKYFMKYKIICLFDVLFLLFCCFSFKKYGILKDERYEKKDEIV